MTIVMLADERDFEVERSARDDTRTIRCRHCGEEATLTGSDIITADRIEIRPCGCRRIETASGSERSIPRALYPARTRGRL